MYFIDKHKYKGAFEGDRFTVESREGHCYVFHETAQRGGAVEKISISWNELRKVTQVANRM